MILESSVDRSYHKHGVVMSNYSVQLALAVSRHEIPFICRSLSGVEAVGTGFGSAQPAIVGVKLTELVDDLLNSYRYENP
jgi:hypothetical protein